MEIKAATYKIKTFIICLCALFLAAATNIQVVAQSPVNAYTIKNGKMYILLNRKTDERVVDSFIARYNLYDIGLKQFVKTKSSDSLKKLGWKIDIDNRQVFVISKVLMAFDNISNPADKIIFAEK